MWIKNAPHTTCYLRVVHGWWADRRLRPKNSLREAHLGSVKAHSLSHSLTRPLTCLSSAAYALHDFQPDPYKLRRLIQNCKNVCKTWILCSIKTLLINEKPRQLQHISKLRRYHCTFLKEKYLPVLIFFGTGGLSSTADFFSISYELCGRKFGRLAQLACLRGPHGWAFLLAGLPRHIKS